MLPPPARLHDAKMSRIEEVRVRDWRELWEALYADGWQEELRRFRPNVVFRGLSAAPGDLSTSLIRMSDGEAGDLEGPLLRAFRRYAHGYAGAAANEPVWYALALAQHHGLPTRLLDWTYSPLVALHFASCDLNAHARDGVIWCVDFGRTNEALPPSLRDLLEREGAAVFNAEMLGEAARTLPEFDALAPEPFVAFYEPPSLDERIVNQFALFSVLSSPCLGMDDWLEDRPEGVARRLIIPAGLKPEVRDKLDQANITERVLLPGLDGLSAWLKRYYTPRPDLPPNP